MSRNGKSPWYAGATAAAAGREDLVADVLPASALGTSSEDYYPTVAINALMRLLRDPSMSSHQQAITQALFEIFRTLGLACVPYLPKVPLLALTVSLPAVRLCPPVPSPKL